MALVQNGRIRFADTPGVLNGAQRFDRGQCLKGLQNRAVGAFNAMHSAYPSGTLAPSAFIMPQKDGSIAARTQTTGTITLSLANLIPAKPMTVNGTLTITVTNAQADKIVPIIASGSLSITATNASLSASIPMTATANLSITSTSALLGGNFPMEATGSLVMTSDVTLNALAFMIAEAGGPTELSPEGLAQAVWNAVLSDYNTAGTTGEALSNASSAGNPWDALLADNNDAGTFGERVQKLLTTGKFIGLK